MSEGLRQYAIDCNYWIEVIPDYCSCKDCKVAGAPGLVFYRLAATKQYQCSWCYCKEHDILFSDLGVFDSPLRLNDRRRKQENLNEER